MGKVPIKGEVISPRFGRKIGGIRHVSGADDAVKNFVYSLKFWENFFDKNAVKLYKCFVILHCFENLEKFVRD